MWGKQKDSLPGIPDNIRYMLPMGKVKFLNFDALKMFKTNIPTN